MTTIATDGITIAADGLVSAGGEITRRDAKKVQAINGTVYALAGHSALFDALVEWHRAGADPEKVPKHGEWTLIVIGGDSSGHWYSETMPYRMSVAFPAAFGTGERYAVGAMHAGKSPKEAVEIATKLDINTGGIITEINIAQALAGTVVSMKAAGRNRR